MKMKKNKLTPLLKYPGGKDKELKYILPNMPENIDRFFEPFVGGGAVYFAAEANEYLINDKSEELMSLYEMVSSQNQDFLRKIKQFSDNWDNINNIVDKHQMELVNIYNKYKNNEITEIELEDHISGFVFKYSLDFNGILKPEFNKGIENFLHRLIKSIKNKVVRMRNIEINKGDLSTDDIKLNIEGAIKAAFYTHFRDIYNNQEKYEVKKPFSVAIYFFIREFCYSSMFRYNNSGKFNVPYGGISYNNKSISKKLEYFSNPILLEKLKKTVLSASDFESFLDSYSPNENDFIFLDPPYDTEFSTYAQNKFEKNDQERLADYLKFKCKANFILVIKNTDFITNLYQNEQTIIDGRKIYVDRFDKKYFVSFQDRNNKEAEHLLITNYPLKSEVSLYE